MDGAIVEYRTSVKLNPNFAQGFLSLGWAYAAQKKKGAAIFCFKRWLELNPKPQDCTCLVKAYIEKNQPK